MIGSRTSRSGVEGRAILATRWLLAGAAFVLLFHESLTGTFRQWLNDADAGHGLLLVPIAFVLAWRSGLLADRRSQPWLGAMVLFAAIVLRYLGGLAAELFTMRIAMVSALFALVIFAWGSRQLAKWWLPSVLLVLSLPLPEIVTGTLARPLQFQASEMGAALLAWRHVPVQLSGNVIHIPGHTLFVTEACSGLRSLSALLALGFLIGGLWLRTWWARAILVVTALPIAMVLNSIRIFLTGFSVFFIREEMGKGVMHYTEGWVMFVAAFSALGAAAYLMARGERALAAESVA